MTNKNQSAKPGSSDMGQVKELVALIKGIKINGVAVACNFIFRRILPCKKEPIPGSTSRCRLTSLGRGVKF